MVSRLSVRLSLITRLAVLTGVTDD